MNNQERNKEISQLLTEIRELLIIVKHQTAPKPHGNTGNKHRVGKFHSDESKKLMSANRKRNLPDSNI